MAIMGLMRKSERLKKKLSKTALVAGALVFAFTSLTSIVNFNQTTSAVEPWETEGWKQVSAGGNGHVCAIASNDQVYCWGENNYGQLGDGTFTRSTLPVPVDNSGALNGKSIVSLSVGNSHSCVLASDNQVYCWGGNWHGQLGNGTSFNSSTPTPIDTTGVLAGKDVTLLAMGSVYGCVVTSDNSVYCWGAYGGPHSTVPVAMNISASSDPIVSIGAGSYNTCALTSVGNALCWGSIGTDSLVHSDKTFRAISKGYEHTCGVTLDGRAYCWGRNQYGQLGGESDEIGVVQVLAGKNIEFISAGNAHTCAFVLGEGVYCWGANENGQLGNNSTISGSSPVLVDSSDSFSGQAVLQLEAGDRRTCAIVNDGQGYCWGDNYGGSLGNGRIADSSIPVRVGHKSVPMVTSVSFLSQDGEKALVISGRHFTTPMGEADNQPPMFLRSLVSLNGVGLPFCNPYLSIGMNAPQLIDMMAEQGVTLTPLLISDTPNCYEVIEMTDDPDSSIILLTPTQAVIRLTDDFDITAPGAVSIDGSPAFAFNQPAGGDDETPETPPQPTIEVVGGNITETPTIVATPTFTGKAPAGSTVTVTVRSDPVVCTTTADANGNWSCTLPSALAAGQHTVTVVVTTPENETIELGPYAVTVAADGSSQPITNETPTAPNTGFFTKNAAIIKQYQAEKQHTAILTAAIIGAGAALLLAGLFVGGKHATRRIVQSVKK